jgi:hypothetical protein
MLHYVCTGCGKHVQDMSSAKGLAVVSCGCILKGLKYMYTVLNMLFFSVTVFNILVFVFVLLYVWPFQKNTLIFIDCNMYLINTSKINDQSSLFSD